MMTELSEAANLGGLYLATALMAAADALEGYAGADKRAQKAIAAYTAWQIDGKD